MSGMKTYSEATKFGKKICVVGDSHLNRIKRNIFQKSVNGGKRYFNVFRGAKSKRLNHYVLPTLHGDHSDVVLLHTGSNDINNQTKDRVNIEKLTWDIINIGKCCIDLDMKEVVISSILPKRNIALTRLTRQVNDSLREQCVLNGFGFISNDNISRTHLWKDGIHLEDLGTNILAGNFVDFLNRFILSKSGENSWLYKDKNLKGLYGNIGVLISENSLSSEITSNISK